MNKADPSASLVEGQTRESFSEAPFLPPQLSDLFAILSATVIDGIIDGIQDGVVIIDRDYRIIASNKFAQDWAKHTADEMGGQLCYEIFHGTEEVCADCAAVATFRTGQMAQTTHTGRDAKGGLTYAEVTTYPVRDNTGAVRYVIEHVKNVSERMRLQQQNASLMATLRESEERYRQLVELSDDLIWTLDRFGNFLWFNRRAEEVSGYKLEDWLGKSFAPMIVPEDLPMVQTMAAQVLAGQPCSYEARVRRQDGRVFVLSVTSAPMVSDGQVTGTVSFGNDITDRKQAEEQLRRRNDELEVINAVAIAATRTMNLKETLEAALGRVLKGMGFRPMGGIFLVDESGQQLRLAAHRGLSPDFIAREHLVKVGECLCGQVAKTGRPLFSSSSHRDPRHTRLHDAPDHAHLVVPLKAQRKTIGVMFLYPQPGYRVSRDDQRLMRTLGAEIGVAIENTQLYERERRLQEQLRFYLQGVIRAREDERRALARDLHDDTAQNLVAITRLSDALAVAGPCHCSGRVEEIRRLADEALAGVRRFAKELRPSVVDDLGLIPALEGLVAETNRRGPVRTQLVVRGPRRRLSAEAELTLFRICQEALSNVVRHAEADSAVIEVEMSPHQVRLSIVDDGKGFHPEEYGRRWVREGRLGLLGMRERAELVNGTFGLHSAPGQGTIVVVEVTG